jgi:hypothetical protein
MEEQTYKQQVRINLRPDSLYRAKIMQERTKLSLSETIEQAINQTFKGTTDDQMRIMTASKELKNEHDSNE